MSRCKKILGWIGFEIVLDIEPHFENQRIVKRGKKRYLQKLTEPTYACDAEWIDTREI